MKKPSVRRVARLTVAAVFVGLVAVVMLVFSRPGGLTDEAAAQAPPTPILPSLLSSPSPSPTPSYQEEGSGSGGHDPSSDPRPDDGDKRPAADAGHEKGKEPLRRKVHQNGEGRNDRRKPREVPSWSFSTSGPFSTSALVAIDRQLRSLGRESEQVIGLVYPPFIIGGEAAWTDTWGAPRYGPGAAIRRHEGQDVFCRYGDPVLAPTAGYVSYSEGGLGGTTARVHYSASSYWYLTHLSATNSREHPQGTFVETGTVIGFCGNSGNASESPPHVHFGWYVNGVARNPMHHLVGWLHEAEQRLADQRPGLADVGTRRLEALVLARRFGDGLLPDLAEFDVSGAPLLSNASSTIGGTFTIAESALQMALLEIPASTGSGHAGDLTQLHLGS